MIDLDFFFSSISVGEESIVRIQMDDQPHLPQEQHTAMPPSLTSVSTEMETSPHPIRKSLL